MPSKRFAEDGIAELKQMIENCHSQYDCLIVYAPNIKQLATENEKIAGCFEKAMLFATGEKSANSAIVELHKALADHNCEILCNNAEALVDAV